MGRLVMKFGGTSVADIERIRNVARHVEREVKAGHHVAVVVSAMAGTTDQLVGWCREAAPSMMPANMTPWSHRANRSRRGFWPSYFRIWAFRPVPGPAGKFRVKTDGVHGSARMAEIDARKSASAWNRARSQ